MSRLKFIFVHGLSGWGSYDRRNRYFPYWGMRNGDLLAYLHDLGYEVYAASVAPADSAWDRACELYAQLSGKKTDYGLHHSREYGHERYGKDFRDQPLLKLEADDRLVLLGHSFGGATIRVLAQLLADGDDAEKASTPAGDLSALFQGGRERFIYALVTLASPLNGTSAYDLFEDDNFDPEKIEVPKRILMADSFFNLGMADKGNREYRDSAAYDMHIDNALAMNEKIRTLPDVYYFSVPCSFSERQADGTYIPEKGMEELYARRSYQMGAYSGISRGGYPIDEKWRDNDGLVNTISAMAPLKAPAKKFERDDIPKGIWNVFETYHGDHMALQGGLMHKHDIRSFYTDLLKMITEL